MAGMARAMGATLMGAQKLLGQHQNLWLAVSSTSILQDTTINCAAASIQRPSNAIIRACCARTKHCDKTGIVTQRNGQTLWQNKNVPLQYLQTLVLKPPHAIRNRDATFDVITSDLMFSEIVFWCLMFTLRIWC